MLTPIRFGGAGAFRGGVSLWARSRALQLWLTACTRSCSRSFIRPGSRCPARPARLGLRYENVAFPRRTARASEAGSCPRKVARRAASSSFATAIPGNRADLLKVSAFCHERASLSSPLISLAGRKRGRPLHHRLPRGRRRGRRGRLPENAAGHAKPALWHLRNLDGRRGRASGGGENAPPCARSWPTAPTRAWTVRSRSDFPLLRGETRAAR
jgi:hypothetical protein